MSRRPTRGDRILGVLRPAAPDYVSAVPVYAAGGFQTPARIKELRLRGFVIENKLETGPDGQKQSFYRLVSEPPEKPVTKPVRPNLIDEPSETLFGDIAADRTYTE
jgi:hypothetical protein